MAEPTTDMKALIAKVAAGETLSRDEAGRAFDIMMSGDATPSQMGALLMGLRLRGATVDEITGAAATMRAKARHIWAPDNAIDLVGTGGDMSGTYNISTCAALVAAGCGVPVAKHGNRAASSQSGSADVLAALGINVEADFDLLEKELREAGFCFMLAQRHHGAMRNVMPTRVELATATVFNILGPLSNPANVRRLFVGTYDPALQQAMAETLGALGAEKVWVVHGSDGLDELTTTGPSSVVAWENGAISRFDVDPADAGIARADLSQLKGADAETNARALRAVLAGEPSAYRDIVVVNAGGALVVAGKADDLAGGIELAADAIDSGKATQVLDKVIAISNEGAE